MTDSVIIDLLVLSLLLAVNFRLFFMTRGQRDVVVLLAPVALCICLLGLFAWDLSLPKALILLLAFFVSLKIFIAYGVFAASSMWTTLVLYCGLFPL
ncbi:MAG: hypothetical protein J6R67_00310 [Treponema sp.]|nr:hypothetical protein [Treponema sp.]